MDRQGPDFSDSMDPIIIFFLGSRFSISKTPIKKTCLYIQLACPEYSKLGMWNWNQISGSSHTKLFGFQIHTFGLNQAWPTPSPWAACDSLPGFMRLLTLFFYSCTSRKFLYQLFTLKLGVRLTHALRGSAFGALYNHTRAWAHSRDACSHVCACASKRNRRKSNAKGATNVLKWTGVLYKVRADNLPGIVAQKPCVMSCKRKGVSYDAGFKLKVVRFLMWLFALTL